MLSNGSRESDFPSLAGRVYLNTAAEGIPPRPVLDALAQYGKDKLLGMDGRIPHQQQWESAKTRTASMYGLSSDEVSICSCSSEAYNLAAMALGLTEGDEVVITDLDFPAGATPWMQPSCPATAKLWRARDWGLRIDDLPALLSSKTRLVQVSLVSFFNGFKVDLPAVVETVRKHSSALVAVDVTQALGRIPLDLNQVDLVISSTHKWILASHGGGLVGVPNRHSCELTTEAGGWFHLENAFDEDRFERTITRPGAASFSVGMPNYAAVYAINAALQYIQFVDPVAIDAYARPLVRACLDGIKSLGVELITPDESDALAGIISFRHPKSGDINKFLHARDIHIMEHAGRLRVAIHGYNTISDIERLLQALEESLGHVAAG